MRPSTTSSSVLDNIQPLWVKALENRSLFFTFSATQLKTTANQKEAGFIMDPIDMFFQGWGGNTIMVYQAQHGEGDKAGEEGAYGKERTLAPEEYLGPDGNFLPDAAVAKNNLGKLKREGGTWESLWQSLLEKYSIKTYSDEMIDAEGSNDGEVGFANMPLVWGNPKLFGQETAPLKMCVKNPDWYTEVENSLFSANQPDKCTYAENGATCQLVCKKDFAPSNEAKCASGSWTGKPTKCSKMA